PPLAFPPIPRFLRLYGFLPRRFRDGTRRASPVARCILVIVLPLPPRQSVSPHRSVGDGPCSLRPINGGSASEVKSFGVTCAFAFVTAQWLARHPKDGFVDRLPGFSFLPPGYPSYRTLTFVLVGLTPTEYTSLRWTYVDNFSFLCSWGCSSCPPPSGCRIEYARSCRCPA